MVIYFLKKTLIKILNFNNISNIILIKYFDFNNIFLIKYIIKLLKYISINNFINKFKKR